jgi:SAM-dependent methyltransferase
VSSSGLDPVAYKERARQQWQQAAEAWYRWSPTLEDWLHPVTEALIELAGIKEGYKVLEVAAGAGEPAVTIAKRVGPSGSVLATDISSNILEFAAKRAKDEGVSNLQTRVLDGESLSELPERSFDAATSRLGLIWFPDRVGALKQIHRALREGARVATAGITQPAENPFSAITMRIIGMRAHLPPPRPGDPGPYSLGSETVMHDSLQAAGFADITICLIDAPLRMASASECARFQREAFAGLDQLLYALPQSEREATWKEVTEALKPLEHDGAFHSKVQFIVGSGARR